MAPLTLVEAAKYSMNAGRILEAGVIEEFARSNDILQFLPFKNIAGAAYVYNREDTLPSVGFRGVNEGFTDSVGIINPQVEPLKIFGGDIKVDKFIVDTLGQGEISAQISMKTKAMGLSFCRDFFKADSRLNPRTFDGLQSRVTGSQLFSTGAAGVPNANGFNLSLTTLDMALDEVDGDNKVIFMNKTMRRLLTTSAKSTSLAGFITYGLDSFGRQIPSYNGIPILIADYDNNNNQILPFTETMGSSNDCTSIYIMSFGDMGVTGLQGPVGGQYGIAVRNLGELELQPHLLTRIEWYCGLAIRNGRSIARIQGIKNAAVVA